MDYFWGIPLDCTEMMKTFLDCTICACCMDYPPLPAVKDAVYDCSLNEVRVWSGAEWTTICTRTGVHC